MSRARALVLLFAGCVAGCWQVNTPTPPTTADFYPWRADLSVEGQGTYFRFDPSPEFWKWADEHDAHALRIVDTNDVTQTCGTMDTSLSVNPFALDSQTRVLDVRPFDTTACAMPNGATPVCIEYTPCQLPSFCPRETFPRNSWPAGVDPTKFRTLEDVLAAANTDVALPNCRPAMSTAQTVCTDDDMIAVRNAILPGRLRMSARSMLVRRGLVEGAQGNRDAALGNAAHNAGVSALRLSNGGVGLGRHVVAGRDESPLLLNALARAPAPDQRGGQLLELHASTLSSDLHLTFNRQVDTLPVHLIHYDDNGHESDIYAPDPRYARPSLPARSTEVTALLSGNLSSGSLRFIAPDTSPDLRLVRVTQVTHTPKPFMHKGQPIYWFKASGPPPYHILLDAGAPSACDVRVIYFPVEENPDANWPPPAIVGMPYANVQAKLSLPSAGGSENPGGFYWIMAALAIWLIGLVFVLGSAQVVRARRRRAAMARRPTSTK